MPPPPQGSARPWTQRDEGDSLSILSLMRIFFLRLLDMVLLFGAGMLLTIIVWGGLNYIGIYYRGLYWTLLIGELLLLLWIGLLAVLGAFLFRSGWALLFVPPMLLIGMYFGGMIAALIQESEFNSNAQYGIGMFIMLDIFPTFIGALIGTLFGVEWRKKQVSQRAQRPQR
jgi:hypothetical protein